MIPAADRPTAKTAPWTAIRADDQETLCRELGGETAGSALLVWYRLSLAAAKARSSSVAVSRPTLICDTRLTRNTVRKRLADLARLGFIRVDHSFTETNASGSNVITLLRGPLSATCSTDGLPVVAGPLPGVSSEPLGVNRKPPGVSSEPLGVNEGGQQKAPFPIFSILEGATGTPRPSTGAAPGGPRPRKPRVLFAKPSMEEVAEYCREKCLRMDPTAFYDHFEANGWKVGKAKASMHDWQAAVRNWARNEAKFGTGATRAVAAIRVPAGDYSQVRMEKL